MTKKLKLSYQIAQGDKKIKKAKVFANIRTQSTDEELKAAGNAILSLYKGEEKSVTKIEEQELV